MKEANEGYYMHISRILSSFDTFFERRDTARECAYAEKQDFAREYKISNRTSDVIKDILWEEDALGIDIKSQYYASLQVDDFIPETPEALTPETTSDTDMVIDEDTDPPSPIKEDSPRVVFDPTQGAESNFVDYTYWTVETGPHVSYTLDPVFSTKDDKAVTLLEEAEAYVAQLIWGEKTNGLQQVSRHILLQAAQVASRAFFDPDYRNYLLNAYVT